jgi:single-stranded-DNA-specific exonuclease
MGRNEFYGNINSISEKVKDLINDRKDTLIVSNSSCDGIVSASLLTNAIWRLGGKATARIMNKPTKDSFEDLKKEDHEFYLFTEVGSGLSDFFNKLYSKDWIVLDHKKISFAEIATDDNNNILNPWKYDIDGEKEISSGGISYLLAKNLDKRFTDLSPLAIVSALGEYQDIGDKRSLVGLNNEILEDSEKNGLIRSEIDLLLSNSESLPIHESIANTFIPYLDGLTSNGNSCLELLRNTNIKLKKDGRWKTIADINQEEKFLIIESIKNYLSSKINSNIENLENILIGYTYVLPPEEYGSQLYDARRFSELLNSCALSMKSGLGMSICLGERSDSLEEAEKDVEEFKNSSQKLISKILKEKWRISDKGVYVFINADGIIEPDYVGYLFRLLTSHYQFMNKVIIMKIAIDENYAKYFLSSGYNRHIDADQMINELSKTIDGIKVTFSNTEGQIIIPPTQEDSLMSIILKLIKKTSK